MHPIENNEINDKKEIIPVKYDIIGLLSIIAFCPITTAKTVSISVE